VRSRAAILYEYGRPWTVEEFELDPPRAGEVLLRLAATGLLNMDGPSTHRTLVSIVSITQSSGSVEA
jgi:Zn-dependent alcohol dehydrogenase